MLVPSLQGDSSETGVHDRERANELDAFVPGRAAVEAVEEPLTISQQDRHDGQAVDWWRRIFLWCVFPLRARHDRTRRCRSALRPGWRWPSFWRVVLFLLDDATRRLGVVAGSPPRGASRHLPAPGMSGRSTGRASDVGGHDVRGMAVQGHPGPVVSHRGPWITRVTTRRGYPNGSGILQFSSVNANRRGPLSQPSGAGALPPCSTRGQLGDP